MLTRLYVDNYKRLVNFDYRPGQIQLLMGGNGSGKSSVFEVLAGLRELLIEGEAPPRVFPRSTITRWLNSPLQTFGLEVTLGNDTFRYELKLNHRGSTPFVESESLGVQSGPIYSYEKGKVTRFDDKHEQLHQYDYGNSQPLFKDIPVSPAARRIGVLRKWLAALVCVNIAVPLIEARSEASTDHPDLNLRRFVGWYHHFALAMPETISAIRVDLAQAIPGLDALSLPDLGKNRRVLRARFLPPPSPDQPIDADEALEFDFDELSSGQRALIVLFTLLHCGLRKGTTVCIDEPDNYIALPEIQPWLMALQDRVVDQKAQALIISHHPELLNQLAAKHGQVFVIRGSGGVTVEPYKGGGTGLPPAEEVASGWDRG